MFTKNVNLQNYKKNNAWRKITIGTWPNIGDPSIYGWVDIDAGPIIKVLKKHSDAGVKLSVTTIMAKAVAMAIKQYPPINAIVRLSRIYRRKDIDIFLQVAPDGTGENLSGITIRDCDKKSLADIALEIKERAGKIKRGNDEEFKKVKNVMNLLPGWMVKYVLNFMSFLQYDLNIWSPAFGSPRDGFGSAMVTSVGMLGLQRGFAPLVPYSRCPIVIAIGKMEKKPVVVNNEIVIREILPICATLDHRLIDGVGGARLLKGLLAYLNNLHD